MLRGADGAASVTQDYTIADINNADSAGYTRGFNAGVASVDITSDNLGVHNAAFTAGEGSARQDLIDDINSELKLVQLQLEKHVAAISAVNNGHYSTVTINDIGHVTVEGANSGTYYTRAARDAAVADALNNGTQLQIARLAVSNGFGVSSTAVTQPQAGENLHSYLSRVVREQVAALPTPTSDGLAPNGTDVNLLNPDRTPDQRVVLVGPDRPNYDHTTITSGDAFSARSFFQTEEVSDVVSTLRDGLNIDRDQFNILFQAIEDAVDAAYDAGYNDGYDDGYADGYIDGFRDGVASVN